MRAIWVNFGIYTTTILWTTIGLVLAIPAFVILRLRGMDKARTARMLIWLYGRVWIWFTSLFIEIELPKTRTKSPCVLVVNHASFFDVYFIGAQSEWNVSMAVRNWPFKISVYKPFMEMAKYVKTETDDPNETLSASVNVLKNNGTMLYFPEGTRSADGQLGRFRSGAFLTALQANVPIQPICISGTHELLPRGRWILSPTKVTVSLLPPIYPDTYQLIGNGHIAMRKDVKRIMAKHLKTMTD